MSFFWKVLTTATCALVICGVAIFWRMQEERANEARAVQTAATYRVAADKGDTQAQCSLGNMYYHGEGVTQNFAEAASWYRKAAEQGFAKGEYDIGYVYQRGQGVSQDYTEAARWYRRASDQGYASAEVSLAFLYYLGQGVSQDYAEAVRLYRKAADQGDPRGEDGLGLMYYRGDGVQQDYAEAAHWYRKAADQGLAKAQYDLGALYSQGRGVLKNGVEATRWFYKAASQGNQDARNALGTALTIPRILELFLQFFGGFLLVLGFCLSRGARGAPQMRIALGAGILCILVAGLSWYGYTHYKLWCLPFEFNAFSVSKWLLDAVLVVLLAYIVQLRKPLANQSKRRSTTSIL